MTRLSGRFVFTFTLTELLVVLDVLIQVERTSATKPRDGPSSTAVIRAVER